MAARDVAVPPGPERMVLVDQHPIGRISHCDLAVEVLVLSRAPKQPDQRKLELVDRRIALQHSARPAQRTSFRTSRSTDNRKSFFNPPARFVVEQ